MTPTHTKSVEVPNRMPHKSYEDIFYQKRREEMLQKTQHNSDSFREAFRSIEGGGGRTLYSMPILMKLPVMVKMSLMMRRIYQPLMNSMRSDQHTSRPRISLKKCTYS